jgi:hypothetical protein
MLCLIAFRSFVKGRTGGTVEGYCRRTADDEGTP